MTYEDSYLTHFGLAGGRVPARAPRDRWQRGTPSAAGGPLGPGGGALGPATRGWTRWRTAWCRRPRSPRRAPCAAGRCTPQAPPPAAREES
eukprot:578521-Prorocentrum_minimum.AAC.1